MPLALPWSNLLAYNINMSDLEEAKKHWEEEKIEPLLARFPERLEEFKTTSGMKVDRLYLPQDADPESSKVRIVLFFLLPIA
jgi:hypothetical protein